MFKHKNIYGLDSIGVMSRRGAWRIQHCANRSKHNSRNQTRRNVKSPLLQNDICQQPTTSYASVNDIDAINHHHVTF
ncbi:hypothetical protein M0804_009050 [Polistes exclamans]|nr:hypothetical protein M0804_009050 [Polistes exclamans]